MADQLSFGRRLKQLRKARDLTQEQLADLAGCAAETIRRFEGDRLRPSRQTARRLAEQLGLAGHESEAFVRAARRQPDPWLAPGDGGSGAAGRSPAPSSRTRLTLPAPATALVGRTAEVAFACALLRRPAPRLLTLTGAGGTGKTRVALEVARSAAADFGDGVAFVALDAITDPALVGDAIGQALSVSEQGGQPIEVVLTRYLRDKQLLLVLDNFEQILDAAPLVASLLTAAPRLKVLVTSRAPLNLTGEHECPILPLPVPELDQLPSPEALGQYAAVELFVQRVQAVYPTFQLTEANSRDVATICWRLDGIPLALILGAAWCKLFRPADLLARLSSGLGIQTVGARDLPARQQTLRATVDWSYQLLNPNEQLVFRRLAVFAGGCTLEAAEAMCTADGALAGDIMAQLQALLDTSLVQRTDSADGTPRLRMLETIRAYAGEQLVAHGEAQVSRHRHALIFLAVAETAAAALEGAEQSTWLSRLQNDHDNLRAALAWLLGQHEGTLSVRLALALRLFWFMRGHLTEGRAWLAQVLELGGMTASERAKALDCAGFLARYQGDYAAAESLIRDSLVLWRELADEQGIADGLSNLGYVCLHQGDYDETRRVYQESLALHDAAGNRQGRADCVSHLGTAAFFLGDYPLSTALHAESLAIWRALGDIEGIAYALGHLGDVCLAQNDSAAAATWFNESLAAAASLEWPWGIACAIEGAAALAAVHDHFPVALRLAGFAARLRGRVAIPLDRARSELVERRLERAHRQLGEPAAGAARKEGEALTLEQAVAEARAVFDVPAAPASAPQGGGKGRCPNAPVS